jgi:hypothetical protein
MFLKNYTSNVPVSQTIYRIEQVLIKCGVSGIMKEYAGTNGEILAITFQIEAPSGKITIRLPADKERALEALWLDYVDGDKMTPDGNALHWNARKKKSKADFVDQSARTAWKIVQDWVEVQMSMIQMKQADTLQVFLPYVYDGKRTYYQALQATNFRGLLPEKCDENQIP